ncbi:MAG: mechanosensitive ion channel family protein, partial [Bacteroidota bacterium]
MLYTPLFKKYYTAFIFIMLLGLPQISHGQLLGATSKDTEAPALEFAADSLGRRNPRGTVDGFLKAMGDQNYTRASQYLTLRRSVRRVSQKKKVVLAFQGLLDRGGDFYPST